MGAGRRNGGSTDANAMSSDSLIIARIVVNNLLGAEIAASLRTKTCREKFAFSDIARYVIMKPEFGYRNFTFIA